MLTNKFNKMKANEGIITIRQNDNTDVLIDDNIVYVSRSNTKLTTDLTKVRVKGYKYSHKEDIKDGEIFIYEPIKTRELENGIELSAICVQLKLLSNDGKKSNE